MTPLTVSGKATMSSALPGAKNYHQWIIDLLRKHLRGTVAEIGFGCGQYTREIAPLVTELTALDYDAACVEAFSDLPENVTLFTGDISDPACSRKIGHGNFDAVFCLNVLEHIKDDRAAVKHMGELLRPGGTLLLLVPAHAYLWGAMDALAGHHRRYTRSPLLRLVREAGFEPTEAFYLNPIGGLGWFLNALFCKPTSLNDPAINWQIRLFDRHILPLSRFLTGITKRIFGQSLFLVAQRREP